MTPIMIEDPIGALGGHQPNPYDNYGKLDGWYGVPNYGGSYNSYLGAQSQPMSMDRIVSMVREIQQGMNKQPMGNQAVSVSPVSQMQIPAQIAANIMNTQNRLLSMPRQRWSNSGSNEMDANNVNHVPSQPAATAPSGGSAPASGGGSWGGGDFVSGGYSPSVTPHALNPNFYGGGSNNTGGGSPSAASVGSQYVGNFGNFGSAYDIHR